ncbi:hypothetical protein T440DRAFT_519413 [Plenodomus tracheiphilus IPT5]|uniref:Xylanolytic transcriptional activator regulatory domain-containing protein n=1 Tax=Plenodomus tracheiphilus IPT5 TaxID=1408161 RepID=A0A6A7B1A2_9PLEO|nr:hypothetical protein T440DRAFT_519413 [Plenodomus tracheiphilus IPT5]
MSDSSKRRAPHDDQEDATSTNVAAAKKRRTFLQTMGQQLREFGTEGTSPQDQSRTSFGTSPTNARPTSRATNIASVQPTAIHVDTPESDAAPGENDQLPIGAAKSASRWIWKADEVLPHTSTSVAPPILFDDLLDWSHSYFDYWHPAFPFLHAPSLLDYFRHVAQKGAHMEPDSVNHSFQHVILRSIMSISTVDRRQTNRKVKALPASFVFHSFNNAIDSIQLVLTEESSILSLQALVSVQLFLITMHRYNAASRLEGLAVRMIFQLGLHRCPSQSQSPTSKESELRKRLFWSVFCIDRYVCIRLGTPLGLRSDELDVCYPHAEGHSEQADKNIEQDDRLDLLDYLARHANIRGSIMQTRSKSALHASHNEAEQALEVEADHTQWWNVVDEHLSDDDRSQSISKAHQVTLIVLRFESVLALHRSILAGSKKDAAYNAALQRCIFASRSIINTLHKAMQGFGAFDGSPGQKGYERTPLLWPSFTWAVWMSVFIIFSASSEGQVPRDVTLRLADRSIEVLKHLSLRGTNWPEACIVAIQNLTARLNERSKSSSRSSTARPGERASFDTLARARDHNGQNNRQMYQDLQSHRETSQYQLFGNATSRNATVHSASNMYPSHITEMPSVHLNATGNFAMPATGVSDVYNLTNSHLAAAGNFLGIAQQSSDNPLPNDDIVHLFNGEDLTYWLGGDNGLNGFRQFH